MRARYVKPQIISQVRQVQYARRRDIMKRTLSEWRIIELYQEGYGTTTISKMLKLKSAQNSDWVISKYSKLLNSKISRKTSRKYIPSKRDKKIVYMYTVDCVNKRDIANVLRISYWTVLRILSLNDIQTNYCNNKCTLPSQEQQDIIREYQATDKGCRKIAQEHACSTMTIHRVLKAAGVATNTKSTKRLSAKTKKAIWKDVNTNKRSIVDTAKKYSVHYQTVSKIRKDDRWSS